MILAHAVRCCGDGRRNLLRVVGVALLAVTVLTGRALAAAGDLDSTFDTDGRASTNIYPLLADLRVVEDEAIQSDGKIVVVGHPAFAGTPGFIVARYNTDGSLDTSFDLDGVARTGLGGSTDAAYAVTLQADGRIVVAGASDGAFALVRYNTDGSLDTGFDLDGIVTTGIGIDGTANSVVMQPDGKIVAAGYTYNGSDLDFAIARYDTDGSLDTGFDVDGIATTDLAAEDDVGNAVALQSDGKIVVTGSTEIAADYDFAVVRYNANGSLDSGFSGDGIVVTAFAANDIGNGVSIQSDGKIVVAGVSGPYFALTRYDTDGSLDTTFDSDGKVTTIVSFLSGAAGVMIQGDGKIVAAGSANGDFAAARYNTDGSLDVGFDGDGTLVTDFFGGFDEGNAVAIQSDGKIVAAGSARTITFSDVFGLVRYNMDGSLDTTFDTDGKVTSSEYTISNDEGVAAAIQGDGKTVVAGHVESRFGFEFGVVRYNTDGSLDTSFDTDGKVTTAVGIDSGANSVVVQGDGKIVVVGHSDDGGDIEFAVARYNSDGSLDTTFDGDGIVTSAIANGAVAYAVAIQSDGKIVAAGSAFTSQYDMAIVRYNTDGSLDTSFDVDGVVITDFAGGFDEARGLAIQGDDKIVAAGNSGGTFGVVRYTTTGGLDSGFDFDGKVTTAIGAGISAASSVVIQSDGKIVAAGTALNTDYDVAVVRYEADGSLDTGFDTDGKVTTDVAAGSDAATSVMIQVDGRIVTAGYSYNGSNFEFALLRYDADGSLDTSFSADGVVTTSFGSGDALGYAGAIQADGMIVVAGTYYDDGPLGLDFAVARYLASGDCAPEPLPSCLEGAKLRLQIRDDTEPERDQLKWKWGAGAAFEQADLGMPLDATTYTLCVYDATGAAASLETSLTVAASVVLWQDKDPKGFMYKDKGATSDGVTKVQIKTGAAGRTKVQVTGKGANLVLPVPFGSTYFDQDPSVVVQLVNSEGTCWTSEFAVDDTTTNLPEAFKASVK